MKRIIAVLWIVGLLPTLGISGKKITRSAIQSLVDTELAFAKKAEADGIRDAFLTYLAEDAIVFRPKPVPGRKVYSEGPAPSGLLTWRPVFADVSGAGDLGYTTGPYVFKEKRTDIQPADYGDYVSIWRRGSHGTWQLVIDLGIPHERPESAPEILLEKLIEPKRAAKWVPTVNIRAEKEALREEDCAFSKASSIQGTLSAYQSYGHTAIRFYRARQFPATGIEAVRKLVSHRAGALVWDPLAAEVAESGDLGYTYGVLQFTAEGGTLGEQSSYLKIWKKIANDRWRVVLDIAIPIPAGTKSGP